MNAPLQIAEKLDLVFAFWVAQRFTAAITSLLSAMALAAEGDCGARQRVFQQSV